MLEKKGERKLLERRGLDPAREIRMQKKVCVYMSQVRLLDEEASQRRLREHRVRVQFICTGLSVFMEDRFVKFNRPKSWTLQISSTSMSTSPWMQESSDMVHTDLTQLT